MLKNFITGVVVSHAMPFVFSGIVALVVGLVVKSKALFKFLPAKQQKIIATDLDIVGQLLKAAFKNGQKKALFAVIKKALADGKIVRSEVLEIIRALVVFVMGSLPADTRQQLATRFGNVEAVVKAWAKNEVFSLLEKWLARLGLKVDLDGSDKVIPNNEVKLRQVFYSKQFEGINSEVFGQEKGVDIPIAANQDIVLAVKGDQNWGHRVWKALWKIKF